jgi:tetratricopeptide (TPR) repeat protein
MKHLYQIRKRVLSATALILFMGGTAALNGCSEDFLKPDPLSVYEPTTTFSTESGLMASLAICDRHLRIYFSAVNAPEEVTYFGTEYVFSDLMVAGCTDKKGEGVDDWARLLTPNSGMSTKGFPNSILYFWNETYNGIKYANTIIQFVGAVESLDEATKNAYKGRAYFHRTFRYMALVFQFGDVPLVTKILEVPKQNYRSTKRDAILQMITKDMEFAVQWVPEQRNMPMIGMVNKGACRMLLAKCYLAIGDYDKAKEQTDILINESGYSLMQNTFGTFNDGGEPQTLPITRNVIWDLHRPENKLHAANTEVILGMPNSGANTESFLRFPTMRIFGPFWADRNNFLSPDGKRLMNYARNNSNYRPQYDYARALGRGVTTYRPSYWSTHGLWDINGDGVEDNDDLRHNSTVGNWWRMDSMKYNDPSSTYFGQNIMMRNPITGKLLCEDSIRYWFDYPHYKIYTEDGASEALLSEGNFRGAYSSGDNATWYLYRLAEAYLLRAEAKFYLNASDPTIADDLNALRDRAQCTERYSGAVTIGDIMNERARELYLEEWRNVELTRVSLCLARSGKPDEWSNTYNLADFDKQNGTDRTGGSYWYQRIINYNFYNNGSISVAPATFDYTMDKHNLYWPIPNAAITANLKGVLSQNYGYDGYDPAAPKWETWEEAVADEGRIN